MTFRVDWLRGAESRSPEMLELWTRLHEATPGISVTSGPAWWRFIEDTFRPEHEHRLAVVHDAGRVVGVFPAACTTTRGRFGTVRTLTHANGPHTYYGDPVVPPDAARETIPVLVRALRAVRDVRRLDVNRVRLPFPDWPEPVKSSADLTVRGGLAAGGISTRVLRDIERTVRRLEERGVLRIERLAGSALRGIGPEFARLHTALKDMQEQWSVFRDNPGSAERLGPALTEGPIAHHAGVVKVSLNGRTLGMTVLFHGGGETLSHRVAWDPTEARFGIGALLMREAIGWSSDRGDGCFRLGPGDEPYKRKWATEIAQVHRHQHVRPRWQHLRRQLGRD
ncbi:MAG TPA: GNAT family N-acetyltransferase [Gemmatimonadales bacterium]|nr:GNAT family N-acetyltransferase [Gemmatimonadales bacterium]